MALAFISKWVSINYEQQISRNIKLKVNILGGVNGIQCDRL